MSARLLSSTFPTTSVLALSAVFDPTRHSREVLCPRYMVFREQPTRPESKKSEGREGPQDYEAMPGGPSISMP